MGLKSDIAVVIHTLSDRGLKLKAVNKHVERKKEIESRLRTKRAKLKSEMNGLTRRLDRVRHKLRKNGQIHKQAFWDVLGIFVIFQSRHNCFTLLILCYKQWCSSGTLC